MLISVFVLIIITGGVMLENGGFLGSDPEPRSLLFRLWHLQWESLGELFEF